MQHMYYILCSPQNYVSNSFLRHYVCYLLFYTAVQKPNSYLIYCHNCPLCLNVPSNQVINIIVLLNLLIAMMNHSYQLISVSSVGTRLFWMRLILLIFLNMKLSDVWSLQIRGQQPAKGAVKEVTMVLEMINLLDRLYFSCPTRLSLREQRNIVISDVLDRFNMMTMMIVQETDNVTRYIQHGRKMMMMIYILWWSVCLSVCHEKWSLPPGSLL